MGKVRLFRAVGFNDVNCAIVARSFDDTGPEARLWAAQVQQASGRGWFMKTKRVTSRELDESVRRLIELCRSCQPSTDAQDEGREDDTERGAA